MQTLVVEDFHCAGCSTKLVDTYIKCAECIGRLCLPCFGNGFESNSHSSNHSYEVVVSHFDTIYEIEIGSLEIWL